MPTHTTATLPLLVATMRGVPAFGSTTSVVKQLAETAVGANVEMGFSPDGKALVNFDLSDKADARSDIWTYRASRECRVRRGPQSVRRPVHGTRW